MFSFFVRIALGMVLLLNFVRPAAAQEQQKEKKHAFDFYLINGVSFAYQQKINKKSNWRLYVSLSGNAYSFSDDGKNYVENPSDAYSSKRENNRTRNTQALAISPQYIFKIKQWGRVKLDLGAGPILTYQRTHYDYDSKYLRPKEQEYRTGYYGLQSDAYSGGISLLGKLDALISEHVALFTQMEWNTVYTAQWTKETDRNYLSNGDLLYHRVIKNHFKGWQSTLHALRVGVSILF